MAWSVPQYSKSVVDRAGKLLVTGGGERGTFDEALQVINNWRSSHSFPLNAMQMNLRRLAKTIDTSALVAQRIKRLSSIAHKLERFQTMKLSQMQDIGGCRAVLSSVARVEAVRQMYCGGTLRHRHQFVRMDDYILKPKPSGYRGVHLIYRYQSDRMTAYNGLMVEIQVRSKHQHAWATAVETMSTFMQQALKSSQGSEKWLRFFSLMGSALALREKRPLAPGTPQDPEELREELKSLEQELKARTRLKGYGKALQSVESSVRNAFYFLMVLDPDPGMGLGPTVAVQEYAKSQLERATADYLKAERALAGRPGADAVLVSVESLEALRKAYPNYFLDTDVFLAAVDEAISGKARQVTAIR